MRAKDLAVLCIVLFGLFLVFSFFFAPRSSCVNEQVRQGQSTFHASHICGSTP